DMNTAKTQEKEDALAGKFASAEEMARAYQRLQAAFTRKCQQASELERRLSRLEEQAKGQPVPQGDACGVAAAGPEKEMGRMDKELSETMQQNGPDDMGHTAWEQAERIQPPKTDKQQDGQAALDEREDIPRMPEGDRQTPGADECPMESQSAWERLSEEEKQLIRLAAIREYLMEVLRGGAPAVFDGMGAPVSPPKRPSSLEEAGRMAAGMLEGK
nr:hypothetical protein [bacterium]